MASKTVLMMAYGGPDSLEDVEPYLLDVRGGRETPPELVEEIRARYAAIGGRSPILEITLAQAQALQDQLNSVPGDGDDEYTVTVGMRHWFPYIRDVAREIARTGTQQIVALCMTPYYSKMSTQAYFEQLDRALEDCENEEGIIPPQVEKISSWHANPLFIQALAEKLEQGIRRFPAAESPTGKIVFSAHSLPAALIEQGDPYQQQILETVHQVAAHIGLSDDCWVFCYQSAGARNTRWLGPSLDETLKKLAQEQIKNVLVAPIGFVSDHVEILFDIDIDAKRQAQAAGIHLERTEALNTSPKFIEALVQIVRHGEIE